MTLSQLIRELHPKVSATQLMLITTVFSKLTGFGPKTEIPDRIVKKMRSARSQLRGL